jgi:hypothetical protein
MDRPDLVTQKHLELLDDLRDSGYTNMFGAGRCLMREFSVSRSESHIILKYWIDTFQERHAQMKE